MVSRKDLILETNKFIYIYEQFETMRSNNKSYQVFFVVKLLKIMLMKIKLIHYLKLKTKTPTDMSYP